MLEFILSNLPILLCALAGMALVVLEVFLPGFGIPGISGIALLIAAIVITAINYGAMSALGLVIIIIALLAIALSISLKSASRGALASSPIVLNDTESSEAGFDAAEDMEVFLGRRGKTLTTLRPAGIAEFEGVRLDVVTEGDYVDRDQSVTIVEVEGRRIVVRKSEAAQQAPQAE